MGDDGIEDHREHPTPDRPLHGERRPLLTPVLAVVGLVVVIALVFALVTWARYAT